MIWYSSIIHSSVIYLKRDCSCIVESFEFGKIHFLLGAAFAQTRLQLHVVVLLLFLGRVSQRASNIRLFEGAVNLFEHRGNWSFRMTVKRSRCLYLTTSDRCIYCQNLRAQFPIVLQSWNWFLSYLVVLSWFRRQICWLFVWGDILEACKHRFHYGQVRLGLWLLLFQVFLYVAHLSLQWGYLWYLDLNRRCIVQPRSYNSWNHGVLLSCQLGQKVIDLVLTLLLESLRQIWHIVFGQGNFVLSCKFDVLQPMEFDEVSPHVLLWLLLLCRCC